MRSAVDEAATLLGPLAQRDVPIGPLTTYKVGGAARLFVRVDSRDALRTTGRVIVATGVSVLVVGRGSNMLVADDGFEGLAVSFGDEFAQIAIDVTTVTAGGFTLLPVLARRTVAAGLAGMEWAVGVPGSVGGAVRMNAGGHGADIAASILDATVFDLLTAREGTVDAEALGLRFRGSDLADHQVVLDARFALAHGDRATSETELAEIVRWRREHQPGGQNAGSVFVNPVPGALAAAELVDGLGLRGLRIGSAHVSEKHANFIQAAEGGRAADVRAVMEAVRQRVWDERGVLLRSEIRLVGFPDAANEEQAGVTL